MAMALEAMVKDVTEVEVVVEVEVQVQAPVFKISAIPRPPRR